MNGKVYLVGAGPGAPDLLTLRAARLLAAAEVVFHDALVHPDVVALATHATKISVGKRCGRHSTAQRFINKRLVDAARTHATVVRLKGGDPMLFGRAQEEIDALTAAGITVEVVPGVSAAFAAAAELQTSLTQRGSARSVALVTPRVGEGQRPGQWLEPLLACDAGAIYMGVGEAAMIAEALLAAGKHPDTPVAIVESASLPEARVRHATVATLPEIVDVRSSAPAIILIGPQFAAHASVAAADEVGAALREANG